jgi:hypothetical protein
MLLLLLLQAAAQAPDISLDVQMRAKSVDIERKGEARLEARAEPDGGSRTDSRTRPPTKGATKLRNVLVDVHAEARIADPQQNRAEAETSTPQ